MHGFESNKIRFSWEDHQVPHQLDTPSPPPRTAETTAETCLQSQILLTLSVHFIHNIMSKWESEFTTEQQQKDKEKQHETEEQEQFSS